ncbi:MAG: ribosome maturation factor RimP [Candidatus Melainabacteria bacterium]|nr:ribosome maturation factor RimP [Candidatus Melainabacteria bacterium]
MTVQSRQEEIISKVEALAGPVAETHGLVLVLIRFTNQGKRRILEITLHRPKGRVSLDDCEAVSRELEARLDELAEAGEPLIEGAYSLQVQSPGIDRKLVSDRDIAIFKGERVEVRVKKAIDGLGTVFTGILAGYDSETGVTIAAPVTAATGESSRKKKSATEPRKAPAEIQKSEIRLERESLESLRLSPEITTETTTE